MRFYANQTSHFSLNAVMFPILIAVVSAPITDHYERNNGNFYSTKLSLSLSLSLSEFSFVDIFSSCLLLFASHLRT